MSPKKPSPSRDALIDQAHALHQAGRLADAAALYAKLLQAYPKEPQVLSGLGTIALQQGNAEEAVRLLGRSLDIAPNQPITLTRRAVGLHRLGHLDAALASYDRAIALRPAYAEAYNNRGVVLRQSAKLEAALASYDRAIALKKDFAEAHNNRANVLQDLRRLDEALASFDRAIALRPGYAEAIWNKARLKILTGDYAEGWRLYEWRWQGPQRHFARNFAAPLWLGDRPVGGKTLLIHAEQGLGDFIQFCRYAPMVEALGAKVVLEVPGSLITLLATLKGDFTLVERGKPLPPFDLHCPIMSLPLAFGTTLASIPAPVPYLDVDADRQMAWRQRLGNRTRPRIGLAWSGSPAQAEDSRRSMPLRALEPLLQLPFEFHALQADIRADDAAGLSSCRELHAHRAELRDFADTAALVREMDLVISVCTSLAHLAGALGQSVWVLLSFMPDYRWMLDRSDSPWYPTATLFRQPRFGDWPSVVSQVAQRLQSAADGALSAARVQVSKDGVKPPQ